MSTSLESTIGPTGSGGAFRTPFRGTPSARHHAGTRNPTPREESAHVRPRTHGSRKRAGWRRRLSVPLTVGALLASAIAFQGAPSSPSRTDLAPVAAPTGCAVNANLVPTCGKTLAGVYPRPRTGGYPQALRSFEQQTGAKTQIVHYFYTGSRLFPNASERASLTQDGAQRLLLANWRVDSGYTWAQVAAGKADARIINEAHYLRDSFNTKFFLTIHHEPENEVKESAGSGYRAEDFAAMFRHVVDVMHKNGATNFVPVLNLMGSQKWADTSWFKALYPGDSYVGWLAFAAYAASSFGVQEGTFPDMLARHWGSSPWRGAYDWATKTHPGKPIMFAEWGIGEKPGAPTWKSAFYRSVGTSMSKYPALKALVYFNNHDAYRCGNIRTDTTAGSLTAYKSMLQDFAN